MKFSSCGFKLLEIGGVSGRGQGCVGGGGRGWKGGSAEVRVELAGTVRVVRCLGEALGCVRGGGFTKFDTD